MSMALQIGLPKNCECRPSGPSRGGLVVRCGLRVGIYESEFTRFLIFCPLVISGQLWRRAGERRRSRSPSNLAAMTARRRTACRSKKAGTTRAVVSVAERDFCTGLDFSGGEAGGVNLLARLNIKRRFWRGTAFLWQETCKHYSAITRRIPRIIREHTPNRRCVRGSHHTQSQGSCLAAGRACYRN